LVWALLGEREGDNQQVIALCDALGWPYERKQLRYGRGSRLPNVFRRALPVGVFAAGGTRLEPPWPDLLVAIGRRSVPLALLIRRRSGGRCRLVHIGRPRAPLGWFDLVVTTPQYSLLPRDNVVELPLPVGAVAPPAPRPHAAEIAEMPAPRTAVLVGGPTRQAEFGAAEARALVAGVNALVAADGGSLMATTSPRTPETVARVLRDGLLPGSRLHEWRPGGSNPYADFLAAADRVVVTGDSMSMLADAVRQAVPVFIHRLPPGRSWRAFAERLLFALPSAAARRRGLVAAILAWPVRAGVVIAPRDYEAIHAALVDLGVVCWLRSASPPRPSDAGAVRDRLAAAQARAVERARGLVCGDHLGVAASHPPGGGGGPGRAVEDRST
jgi:hypothetical protein